jgi:hypothetical protein
LGRLEVGGGREAESLCNASGWRKNNMT